MTKRGRPSKGILAEGVKTHVSADLPPELSERFRAHSAETHIPLATLIRLAIAEYLENHGSEKKRG